jgi:hypothetical protein
MTKPTREEIIQKIKDRIEYHADEKKYGYFLGRDVIDYLAKDILRDLQIDELEPRIASERRAYDRWVANPERQ